MPIWAAHPHDSATIVNAEARISVLIFDYVSIDCQQQRSSEAKMYEELKRVRWKITCTCICDLGSENASIGVYTTACVWVISCGSPVTTDHSHTRSCVNADRCVLWSQVTYFRVANCLRRCIRCAKCMQQTQRACRLLFFILRALVSHTPLLNFAQRYSIHCWQSIYEVNRL